LLSKDVCLVHQQFDAINSEYKPKLYEVVVADLFNGREFIPLAASDPLPELHSDFSDSIHLAFANMHGPITLEQVKSKMADTHCKLMKIINRWERSYNWFGQLPSEKPINPHLPHSGQLALCI